MVQEWDYWFSTLGVPSRNILIHIDGDYKASYNSVSGFPEHPLINRTYPMTANLTNTSNMTWIKDGPNAVSLGYHWINASTGAIVTYDDGQRGVLGSDLAPGGSGAATIEIKTPASPGRYILKFDMVQEWVTWFSWQGVATRDISAPMPLYNAEYGAPVGAPSRTYTSKAIPMSVLVTNFSQMDWSTSGPNAVSLGYHWVNADTGQTVVFDDRQRGFLGSDLAAGASRSIAIEVKTPTTPGNYNLKFDMVQEWITWFSWQGVATKDVAVAIPLYGAEYTVTGTPATAGAGQTFNVSADLTNTGSLTWTTTGPNAVKLGYHWVNASTGAVVVYDDWQRGTLSTNPVLPDGTTTTTLTVKAPSAPGIYTLKFDLVREWITWFSWQGAATKDVSVTVPSPYSATYNTTAVPATLTAGATTPVVVNVTNTSQSAWTSTGTNAFKLGYHWVNASTGAVVVYEDWQRGLLGTDLGAGASQDVTIGVKAPSAPAATS